ncbi:methyltransferase domain-containing protein [Candidatus Sumerlaeota bacterium]|nr:methyltransferase domain-containing protein [Candidatus Sumerlaeota bacterium]
MKTRQKIFLDRIVGPPLILVVRTAARILGRLLGRDHSAKPSDVRTIVVAKFLGMGSILQATPLMKHLKESFPKARLVMLSTPANKGLLDRLSFIDDEILIDDKGFAALLRSTASAILKMQRMKVDLYFDLEVYSSLSSIVSLATLARNRYGFYRQSAEFKRDICTHLMYFNMRRPVRLIYLQLGRLATKSSKPTPKIGPIDLTDVDRNGASGKLAKIENWTANGAYTVVNPNASDLMLERRWPAARYAELIDRLAEAGRTVVLVGAPNEAPHVESVIARTAPHLRGKIVNTAGQLSLGELFAVLQQAGCVITNDSGPMHMAVTLGAPTVCLFGPVEPMHYGFDAEPFVRTIYQPVYCSPCVHEVDEPPCGGNNICMQLIGVDKVLAAHEELVSGAHARAAVIENKTPVEYDDSLKKPLGRVILGRTSMDELQESCLICGSRDFDFLFEHEHHRFYHCRKCGLERSHPQPTDETLGRIYGKHYYDAWGLAGGEKLTQSLKQAFFTRSLAHLGKPQKNQRLLDCGAATGYLMEVGRKLGYDAYGNELSEFGASEIAKKFGADHVYQGPFEDAHFPSVQGFDVITMFDFIEHVRDPESVLRKAMELLSPGGKILICTPNAGSLSRKLMGRNWLHIKVEHLHFFNSSNLGSLLKKTGFRNFAKYHAWKVMNLHYVSHQLNVYRHWLLTPLINTVTFVLPFLKDRNFSVSFGEMIIEAQKPD